MRDDASHAEGGEGSLLSKNELPFENQLIADSFTPEELQHTEEDFDSQFLPEDEEPMLDRTEVIGQRSPND